MLIKYELAIKFIRILIEFALLYNILSIEKLRFDREFEIIVLVFEKILN